MLFRIRKILRNQKGFTLVEVLIAIAITAAIGAGLAMAVFEVIQVNAMSNNRMEAIKQVENAFHYIIRDAQMTSPHIDPPTSGSFINSSLRSNANIGNTSIQVTNTTNFPDSGWVVIGTDANKEIAKYTSKTSTRLSGIPSPGLINAHASGEQVSNALALHWTDFNDTNYIVTYSIARVDGIKLLRRMEKIGDLEPVAMDVARYIDNALSSSNYDFDGKVLTVKLTASTGGYKSATETRTVDVAFRMISQ